MTEIQWFRLMLVLLITLTLSAGAAWGFETLSARDERIEAAAWAQRAIAGTDPCVAAHPNDAASCVNLGYESMANEFNREAGDREPIASAAIWFLWMPQLGLVFLFYGVRWAILGKVRPLWLLWQV